MREEIQGANIVLRRYKTDFIPLLYEAAMESRGGEFERWMPWCHENYSIADSEAFIENLEDSWEDQTIFGFAVFDARTDEFLGGIGLNQPNNFHQFYNLGYWIRISCQNRGIASEATRLIAKTAFKDLAINRIEIVSAVENIPSQKAAEKSGAIREGVLRKRLVIGDRVHDAVMFSFVQEDFNSQVGRSALITR